MAAAGLLVAMDYFTKWPEAYTVPDQSASTTARKLVEEMFCLFGAPGELHSDQGRNFESRVFGEVCKRLGVSGPMTPGDRVWIYCSSQMKGVSPKLRSHWRGPGKVLQRLGEVVYRVRMPGRGREVVLHRDRLAPYQPLAQPHFHRTL
ncbi:hypothetical protein AAFF_G00356150 [Aldrovandia affinis]|uniref:Integrase catalytic domain-containing protein n=1 Tax=Aldrovandia affinis TaxID=143900 RepID=A0AAD7T8N7_9TELE|nr:hypothetical protein AAFF_G00356150 [Aldrovandia affinis]